MSFLNKRKQLLAKLTQLQLEDANIPPIVSLDEYFEDNIVEDCIACNQVGYGRPHLKELYGHFQKIQQKEEVQTVMVGLHFDWAEAFNNIRDWPYAENIYIYANVSIDILTDWVDLEYIKADCVINGWLYGEHPSVLKPNLGFNVFTICWD